MLIAFGTYLGILAWSGFGRAADVVMGIGLALIAAGAAMLAGYLALFVLGRLRRHLGFAAAGSAAAAVVLLQQVAMGLGVALAIVTMLGAILLTAGVISLLRTPRAGIRGSITVVIGAALLAAPAHWWLTTGHFESPVAHLVRPFVGDGAGYEQLLERGPHAVGFFTYGSGSDRLRIDYADGVRFTTEPVDGSVMLEQGWDGWRGRMRDRLWGFGKDALPLNARVWHPQDLTDFAGPRPLVLIVHGNAHMLQESDRGYAYLGEHLASRGYIVASVDQNFLNNGGPLFDGVRPENDARGWLLLEHLRLWRDWSEDDTHPFGGKVDLDRVTLMGHSRGGEAVYLAAAFNTLAYYPDDARLSFDYGFGIRAVVAIAPVDGQFRPSGKRPAVADVSYFTIHGGYDGDAAFFDGDRQYHRAVPSTERRQFKASVYVHHANHGQFNTVWGRRDQFGPVGRALNTRPILDGDEQRRIATAYFTAFIDAAIDDAGSLPPMFCSPRSAGGVLPADLYISRCDDGRRIVLADFEHGIDITRGNDARVRLDGHGLALWKEDVIPLRLRDRERSGVWLGWRNTDEEPGGYTVSWDAGFADEVGIGADSVIWLEIAHADADPPAAGAAGADEADGGAAGPLPANGLRAHAEVTVELVDSRGAHASLPLGEFHDLLPPLPVQHFRDEPLVPGLGFLRPNRLLSGAFSYMTPTEPLLQSIAIPLRAFAGEIDVDSVRAMRLLPGGEESGVIVVDEISIGR